MTPKQPDDCVGPAFLKWWSGVRMSIPNHDIGWHAFSAGWRAKVNELARVKAERDADIAAAVAAEREACAKVAESSRMFVLFDGTKAQRYSDLQDGGNRRALYIAEKIRERSAPPASEPGGVRDGEGKP